MLVLSDSPETFKDDGILCIGNVHGAFRVFLHHQNGGTTERDLNIRFISNVAQQVSLHRTEEGGLPVSIGDDPAQVGQQATAVGLACLDRPATPVMLSPAKPYEVTISMGPGQVVSGWMDGTCSSPLRIEIGVGHAPTVEPTPSPSGPGPFAIRGTFPQADRQGTVQFAAGGTFRLDLGSPRTGPYAAACPGEYQEGRDETSGLPVWNIGNYGVLYHLQVASEHPAQLLWSAAGGPSRFVVGEPDKILVLDTLLPPYGSWLVGEVGPNRPMLLDLTIPGGSFGAGRLLARPAN